MLLNSHDAVHIDGVNCGGRVYHPKSTEKTQ